VQAFATTRTAERRGGTPTTARAQREAWRRRVKSGGPTAAGRTSHGAVHRVDRRRSDRTRDKRQDRMWQYKSGGPEKRRTRTEYENETKRNDDERNGTRARDRKHVTGGEHSGAHDWTDALKGGERARTEMRNDQERAGTTNGSQSRNRPPATARHATKE